MMERLTKARLRTFTNPGPMWEIEFDALYPFGAAIEWVGFVSGCGLTITLAADIYGKADKEHRVCLYAKGHPGYRRNS